MYTIVTNLLSYFNLQDTAVFHSSDFVTCVNKVREVVSSLSRQLNSHPLIGNGYEAFLTQEAALKVLTYFHCLTEIHT